MKMLKPQRWLSDVRLRISCDSRMNKSHISSGLIHRSIVTVLRPLKLSRLSEFSCFNLDPLAKYRGASECEPLVCKLSGMICLNHLPSAARSIAVQIDLYSRSHFYDLIVDYSIFEYLLRCVMRYESTRTQS